MNDHSDHFKNNAVLIAMAIYPDKKESLRQAQLYVTKRGLEIQMKLDFKLE
ncbi:hypothetical protein MJ257_14790 [Paenibacillus timonensis]|uniref:Uncharacterized protein n=1 Tax=Paenibacillus timonensis TaxID=225915 RepID=A0ABW3SFI9_9BACL|nr:hypothetical protein [Paenibacillus timonensis]MCH1641377.1 hypothetical protein [Paenibacillus timonensis]